MLQVARLSRRLLGDSAGLVESFVRSTFHADGGFQNRVGDSDLYYTVFGLESLIALQAQPPTDEIVRYLHGFEGGEELDFVHLACLGRCWAGVGRIPPPLADRILARTEEFRAHDGGYNQTPDSPEGSVYASFMAMGLYQDLGRDLPHPDRLLASLHTLRADDGGFSNFQGAAEGITPATAAAVTMMRQLGGSPDRTLAQWLLARSLPSGGFFAMPDAPIPDLLSTATALHALAGLQVPLNGLREPCLDFIDSLWTNRGGFFGHWSDDAIDTEYTYYALLSLGHLS